MYPEIIIRILDLDGIRLAQTEKTLRRMLKERNIEAQIICIGCGLEIARQGFSNALPALIMNQYLASEGTVLGMAELNEFCDKLETWINIKRAREKNTTA